MGKEIGFNLDSMLGAYKDHARGYLFKFEIHNAPTGFWRDKYPYLVRSTTIPSSTLAEIKTDWQGMEYKLAGTQTYEDFTVTFAVDPAAIIRYDFVNWINFIHDPSTNVHGNPSSYMCLLELSQLDVEGKENIKYQMVNAWPKTISAPTLDYATKDILKFDVTFAYQYHKLIAV